MLKKETLEKIAATMKIKATDLETAIKDEKEVDVVLPEDLTVLTTKELTDRDKNKKDEGIRDGRKAAVKDMKEKVGLTFEENDADKFVTEFKKKIETDAKIEPTEKVKQLQDQVDALTKDNEVIRKEKESVEGEKKQISSDFEIIADFPGKRSDMMNEREYLSTLRMRKVEFKEDGVYRDGQLIKDDKTHGALPRKQALETLFNEYKWGTTEEVKTDGRGGGNSGVGGGNKPTKMSEAQAAWEKDGKDVSHPDFITYTTQLKTENPAFDTRA